MDGGNDFMNKKQIFSGFIISILMIIFAIVQSNRNYKLGLF